jgi:hypothetical protein
MLSVSASILGQGWARISALLTYMAGARLMRRKMESAQAMRLVLPDKGGATVSRNYRLTKRDSTLLAVIRGYCEQVCPAEYTDWQRKAFALGRKAFEKGDAEFSALAAGYQAMRRHILNGEDNRHVYVSYEGKATTPEGRAFYAGIALAYLELDPGCCSGMTEH